MVGEVRGVELLEERERACLDVGALVLVREVDGGVELAGTVCGSCAREMAVRARNGQKAIFDKLPEIFGIEVEGWGTDQAAVVAVEGE